MVYVDSLHHCITPFHYALKPLSKNLSHIFIPTQKLRTFAPMEISAAQAPPTRYAVVTGANKGIGFETVRQLANAGATVVLTARDEKRGKEATKSLHESGLSNVVFHQLDVRDAQSIESLAEGGGGGVGWQRGWGGVAGVKLVVFVEIGANVEYLVN